VIALAAYSGAIAYVPSDREEVSMDEPTQPSEPAEPVVQDDLAEDVLVEEVSIDGMCGVY
jgi:mycofactocin precursor